MTRLLILLLLCTPASWAYLFKKTLTIDHTKCGSVDSTNFPVLVSGTVNEWATVANGGKIQNTVSSGGVTVPADLKFTSDLAGSTLLKWHIVSYTAATGAFIARVKIPTVSASADTLFYAFYDDATVSTFQGDITGTYNSNYLAFYNMQSQVNDATSNARNFSGSPAGGYITGKVGSAALSNDGNLARSDTGFPATNAPRTVSFWMRESSNSYSNYAFMYGTPGWALPDHATGRGPFFAVYHNFSGNSTTSGVVSWDWSVDYAWAAQSDVINNWVHVAVTYSNPTVTFYVNGVSRGTPLSQNLNTTLAGATGFNIGYQIQAMKSDEFRIQDASMTASWILTEYNNENDPATFMSFSSETSASGSNRHRVSRSQ